MECFAARGSCSIPNKAGSELLNRPDGSHGIL